MAKISRTSLGAAVNPSLPNKELCQKLYTLSHWNPENHLTDGEVLSEPPRYDLEYILDKLPPKTTLSKNPEREEYGIWLVGNEKDTFQEADTPIDAALKLTIALFENGVLQKGTE